MNFKYITRDRLMWRYIFFGPYLSIAIVGGLACSYSPLLLANNLNGHVYTNNMPNETSIKNHLEWIKLVAFSENAGEIPISIDKKTISFRILDIKYADNFKVYWRWLKQKSNIEGLTHALFPLEITVLAGNGNVSFTFYDLGTIHQQFITEVEKQTKKKEFSKADEQIERANNFYELIREWGNVTLSNQADSWSYALYQTAFDTAHLRGLRRIDQSQKEKVRNWLKDWINLCIEKQTLRSRLSGALQSWSKFSKLAYSRVSDWPEKMLREITDEDLNKVFLNPEFRDWMIEDMNWLHDEVFLHQSVRPDLDEKPYSTALLPHQIERIPLSDFAQAITDFANEEKIINK